MNSNISNVFNFFLLALTFIVGFMMILLTVYKIIFLKFSSKFKSDELFEYPDECTNCSVNFV